MRCWLQQPWEEVWCGSPGKSGGAVPAAVGQCCPCGRGSWPPPTVWRPALPRVSCARVTLTALEISRPLLHFIRYRWAPVWEVAESHSEPAKGPLQRMQVHTQGEGKLEIQLSIDLTVDVVYVHGFVCRA